MKIFEASEEPSWLNNLSDTEEDSSNMWHHERELSVCCFFSFGLCLSYLLIPFDSSQVWLETPAFSPVLQEKIHMMTHYLSQI